MRMTGLWTDVIDGRPQLDPRRARTDDEGLKTAILSYLRGGALVLRAPTLQDDQLDANRKRCVPVLYYTDGQWIWSAEDIYYLETHGILPEADFLATMKEAGYQAPAVTTEQVTRAREHLTGSSLGASR